MRSSILIVGGGLAGSLAAWALSEHHDVTLLDTPGPAAPSTRIPAGLANPLMARRANPPFRARAALEAIEGMVDSLELRTRPEVLRPASRPSQAEYFMAAAAEHPDLGTWVQASEAAERYPWLRAPAGVLRVHRGRSFELPQVCSAAQAGLERRGGQIHSDRLAGWRRDGAEILATTSGGREMRARTLVLALGAGFGDFRETELLDLHAIKGQVIEVAAGEIGDLLPCSGGGYVVPVSQDRVVVGSSYQHEFSDLAPATAVSDRLLKRAAEMVPALARGRIAGAHAALRMTVPETRLPMVGPVAAGVWVLAGLGSKGLLMGALIASALPAWLKDASRVPGEFAIRHKSG